MMVSTEANGEYHHAHHVRRAKLDFTCYLGDGPTVWLDHVVQYFDYQRIPEENKVLLAAFHLEREANHWWQWMKKIHREENITITWEGFEKELLIQFGPTEIEDYDEALSRIQQSSTLRDYQQNFERLANRVSRWPQKSLGGYISWRTSGGYYVNGMDV
jgi:hypothetical protein